MRRHLPAVLLLIWVLGLIWPAGEASANLRQTTVRERRIRPQHGRISWQSHSRANERSDHVRSGGSLERRRFRQNRRADQHDVDADTAGRGVSGLRRREKRRAGRASLRPNRAVGAGTRGYGVFSRAVRYVERFLVSTMELDGDRSDPVTRSCGFAGVLHDGPP